jgi:diketogulonate reductase-like aldo/keto reductase
LGTYLARSNVVKKAVKHALEIGYRHFDTAKFYGNEKEIGDAIRESGVPRDEVFVTTKLWNDDHGYDMTLQAFEESLSRLGFDYIDLYLIHWPVSDLRLESWNALEKILLEEKVRAIGVSNYMIHHLEELFNHASILPMVNQVEFHPFLYQKELLEYCIKNKIVFEAYSPLTKGDKLQDPNLGKIAMEYNKSPPQILIRWALQHNTVVLPKSSDPSRISENADVYEFQISSEDMKRLNELNTEYRSSWNPMNIP